MTGPAAFEDRLQRRFARVSYEMLQWAEGVPVGLRSMLGVLLAIGGVFGFLPILGFWMFPLGVAFVALDLPWMRHRIHRWKDTLKARAVAGTDP